MKARKLQIIRWVDSASTPRWKYPSEIDHRPATCVTVGWLVHDTKDAITLAQTQRINEDYDDVNACMTIPRGCIKSRRTIK